MHHKKDRMRMANKTYREPLETFLEVFIPFSVSFSRALKVFLQFSLCNYGKTNRKGARRAVMQSDPVIGPSKSYTPAMQEVNKARLFLTMSLHSVLYFSFSNSPTDGSSISLSVSLRSWCPESEKGLKIMSVQANCSNYVWV